LWITTRCVVKSREGDGGEEKNKMKKCGKKKKKSDEKIGGMNFGRKK
jgi:uncharacterized protein YcbX